MGTKKKTINGDEFEILDHEQVPGYKTTFHIVVFMAVLYLIYVFVH